MHDSFLRYHRIYLMTNRFAIASACVAILALAAFSCQSAYGQASTDIRLHVTATPQDRHDTDISFGKLGNHIAAAADICTASGTPAIKIPTARVRQKVILPKGVTLLPAVMAATVVQDAQGKAPLDTVVRVLGGLSSAGGAAAAIHGTTGWGSTAILAGEGISIALQYIFPTLRTHAVLSIATLMLPEMLDFDPAVNGGCVSGIAIVAVPKKTKTLEVLNQDVVIENADSSASRIVAK